MDDIDHALLTLLTKDARASATDLSEALGVSRGTVRNRIDALVARDVIRRFTVDLGSRNADTQVSALTLVKLSASDGRATLRSLSRLPEVVEISNVSGNFDMAVELRTPTLGRLDTVLDQIRALSDVAETQSHIRLSTVAV